MGATGGSRYGRAVPHERLGRHPAGRVPATAAEFLNEAAADSDGKDAAVRQLAALQGIGYALLALGEQLTDRTDATADCAVQLAGIAAAVDGLHQPRARLHGLLARLRGGPGA
jgi:hypothetical protein